MRDLTPEEDKIARDAIYAMGPAEQVIAKVGNDSVQRGSVRRLRPGKWLNDESINYFLKICLAKRDENLCTLDPNRKRSHFFNSFFIQTMMREEDARIYYKNRYKYTNNIENWGDKVPGKDIFKLKYIFVPWNKKNYHWCGAIIKMKEKRIEWHDSLGGNKIPILNELSNGLRMSTGTKRDASCLL